MKDLNYVYVFQNRINFNSCVSNTNSGEPVSYTLKQNNIQNIKPSLKKGKDINVQKTAKSMRSLTVLKALKVMIST